MGRHGREPMPGRHRGERDSLLGSPVVLGLAFVVIALAVGLGLMQVAVMTHAAHW